MINPYSEIDKLYVQIKTNADVSTSSICIPTREQCTLTSHRLHCSHVVFLVSLLSLAVFNRQT